jgi:hypothetical protein
MFGMLAITALVAAACSSGGGSTSGSPKDQDSTRTASANGIEVQANWLTQEAASQDFDLTDYPADRFLYLEVKLDTHSGDLKSIELPGSAELRQGDRQFEPEAWVASNDDAHHREGLLVVAREFEEGPVELVLQLGDDILSLRWDTVPRA